MVRTWRFHCWELISHKLCGVAKKKEKERKKELHNRYNHLSLPTKDIIGHPHDDHKR